jgi:hypothetical protein
VESENNSPDCNPILEAKVGVSTGLHDDILAWQRIKNIFVLTKHETHTGKGNFNS